MKSKLMIVLVVLLSSTLFNTALLAQGQCQKMGDPNGMGCSKPEKGCCGITNLTPDQQKQIDALHLNLVKETIIIKNQINEKKAHLITVSTGDNIDMVAVSKTVDELFMLKAELEKKHIAFMQDVRKLLTPEQKIMFDAFQSKKGGKDCDDEGKGGMKCGQNGTSGQNCGGMNGGQKCGQMGQGGQGAGCGMKMGEGQGGCKSDGAQMGGGCKDKAGAGQGAQTQGGCKDKAAAGQGGCKDKK